MKVSYALIGLGLMATTASAADLPSRQAPLPPHPRPVVQQPAFFVGAHLGGRESFGSNGNEQFTTNIRAGYEFSPFARAEVSYDFGNGSNDEFHQATVNGIAQYRLGSFVPYALAGVGYRWTELKNEPVYAVGGGIRYEFTKKLEVDARYRYVTDRDRNRDDSIVTVGLNYKF